MRFLHADGTTVHLSYCSNVHPAETTNGIIEQVQRFAGPVRRRLEVGRLGVGLWIPALAARAFLDQPDQLTTLKQSLENQHIEVVTLNAFPYGGFHDEIVKQKVYSPNWTQSQRLDYTKDCARLLAMLLPEDIENGSISTLPFAWPSSNDDDTLDVGQQAMHELAQYLAEIHRATGKTIRLAVEPEPGCIVETTQQAADALQSIAPEWIGACLDMCHMAVQFEDPANALAALQQTGVQVVKSQVSSAIRMADPEAQRELLLSFVEPRFLHQTRTIANGLVLGVNDLDEALDGALPTNGEWRVHHHQPIHRPGEETTQTFVLAMLSALVGGKKALTTHLDVETYTWSVLPEQLRPSSDQELIAGIAQELSWARNALLNLGLKEVN